MLISFSPRVPLYTNLSRVFLLTTPLFFTQTHIPPSDYCKMYTYTPTHRFLVLSAANSAPFNPNNKFLVLSPTESGPDPRSYDEEAVIESSITDQIPDMGPSVIHRSNSSSSSASSDSQFNDVAATLPNGFLFLGHTKTRKTSQ